MDKQAKLKKEFKEVLSISAVFFVIFVLLLLLKKVMMANYEVDFFVISTALVGALIIAKVVLVFDLLPITKKADHLPNIYRVFFRSFIYIIGYVIFTFLEHIVNGLIHGESFSEAVNHSLHNLTTASFTVSFVGVFIAFLIFNAFWVVRATIGPAALYAMFFKRN